MVRDNKQKCWNVFGVSKPHYTDMEIKPGDDNLRCISIQKISQYPSVSLHFHLSTEKFPWKCLCYLDHYSKMHFFPSVLQSFAVAVQCCTLALAVRTASCRTILVHPSHVLMVCVCQIIKGTSATALHKLLETGETHTAKLLKSHMHIMSLVKVLRSLINLH